MPGRTDLGHGRNNQGNTAAAQPEVDSGHSDSSGVHFSTGSTSIQDSDIQDSTLNGVGLIEGSRIQGSTINGSGSSRQNGNDGVVPGISLSVDQSSTATSSPTSTVTMSSTTSAAVNSSAESMLPSSSVLSIPAASTGGAGSSSAIIPSIAPPSSASTRSISIQIIAGVLGGLLGAFFIAGGLAILLLLRRRRYHNQLPGYSDTVYNDAVSPFLLSGPSLARRVANKEGDSTSPVAALATVDVESRAEAVNDSRAASLRRQDTSGAMQGWGPAPSYRTASPET
ncbi:hypothetical protein HGRIS_002921 [Hohenbuehelia grisea]|uniref:Uncharacterized protein n=1 Tax=Hohenbuehelia grisea TaxID=104357 RepID=A0ABR3JLX5_9AGAR